MSHLGGGNPLSWDSAIINTGANSLAHDFSLLMEACACASVWALWACPRPFGACGFVSMEAGGRSYRRTWSLLCWNVINGMESNVVSVCLMCFILCGGKCTQFSYLKVK